MAKGLNQLRKILLAGGLDAKKAERLIGETFFTAADDVPGFFQRGRTFADGTKGLEEQFGTRVNREGNFAEIFANDPRTLGPAILDTYSQKRMLEKMFANDNLRRAEISEFPKQTNFVEYNTSDLEGPNLSGGTGAGKGVYATLFGMLNEDPYAVNFTSALTDRNKHRRSYNQAAAILREPKLGKKILIDPYQVTHTPDGKSPRPRQFMKMDPVEQVGRLQAEGALQTLRRLENTMRSRDTYPAQLPMIRDIAEETVPFGETSGDFARAADNLRRSGAPASYYDTIGASALRKAGLIDDLFSQRGLRRDLFQGLEFRRGGPVR